jgi:peroxiredoxin
MALPIGTKAPDFTLKRKTADGLEDVRLSDRFGKKNTVLLFFPMAFTSVCTQEMCQVSQGLIDFARYGADVLAISVDNPFAQEAWAKQEGITIPLLSDLDKEVAGAYGVLLPKLAGIGTVAARAAFVIDQEGVIQYSEVTPSPKELPHFDRIEETLKRLG